MNQDSQITINENTDHRVSVVCSASASYWSFALLAGFVLFPVYEAFEASISLMDLIKNNKLVSLLYPFLVVFIWPQLKFDIMVLREGVRYYFIKRDKAIYQNSKKIFSFSEIKKVYLRDDSSDTGVKYRIQLVPNKGRAYNIGYSISQSEALDMANAISGILDKKVVSI